MTGTAHRRRLVRRLVDRGYSSTAAAAVAAQVADVTAALASGRATMAEAHRQIHLIARRGGGR